MAESATRTRVELTQTVYWDIDVTDSLEEGRTYTDDELQKLARGVWEYRDYGSGSGCECTGWGWPGGE